MDPHLPATIPQIAGYTLDDLHWYLDIIDPVTYQAPLDILSGSTIGQHTRHIIEFYNCLVEQYQTDQIPVIRYDQRRRDIEIETRPELALQYVRQLKIQLRDLDPDTSCLLDCTEHSGDTLRVVSTIGRELVYNIEHTIHHLAIVKIAIRTTLPSLHLPEHFGVAPSTLRYRHPICAP